MVHLDHMLHVHTQALGPMLHTYTTLLAHLLVSLHAYLFQAALGPLSLPNRLCSGKVCLHGCLSCLCCQLCFPSNDPALAQKPT
jgi:hypothetical protein